MRDWRVVYGWNRALARRGEIWKYYENTQSGHKTVALPAKTVQLIGLTNAIKISNLIDASRGKYANSLTVFNCETLLPFPIR